MKRGLWAVAGLLTLVQIASADYFVIRINIGTGSGKVDPGPGPGNQIGIPPRPGAQIGVPPGPGATGKPPGGEIGLPPGPGATGLPPGPGATGRPPGGMNIGGVNIGVPGQMGGVNIGMPGQMGGVNIGLPGQMGGVNIGLPGQMGGVNIGVPGQIGGVNIGMPPKPNPQPPAPKEEEWFLVVVEGELQQIRGEWHIVHQWGSTPCDPRSHIPDRAYVHYQKHASIEAEVAAKAAELQRSPAELAKWMLDHWNMPAGKERFSMRTHFEQMLDRWQKDTTVKEDSLAGKQRAALLKMRKFFTDESFNGKLKPDEKLNERVMTLAKDVNPDAKMGWRVSGKGPYQMIYAEPDEKEAEQRLRRLEHFYVGFYYWFALHGHALPPPPKQLLCVLAKDVDHFRKLHKIFDDAPRMQDGFYSDLDNVTVFSPSRLDQDYENFEKQARGYEATLKKEKISYDSLFKGEALPKEFIEGLKKENAISIEKKEHPLGTMLTFGRIVSIALHAAREEGEIATITNEGLQQLAQASGLFPRRVRLPESIRSGFGAMFETPKSKVVGKLMQPAIWPGIGMPHWCYQPVARELFLNEDKTVKLDGEHEVKLGRMSIRAVLRDFSFTDAAKADRQFQEIYYDKARAEAWALTYFLMKATAGSSPLYFDKLLAFYKELDRFPRDQDLQPELVEKAFVKAFQLGAEGKEDAFDPKKLADLEGEWKKFIVAQDVLHKIELKMPAKP